MKTIDFAPYLKSIVQKYHKELPFSYEGENKKKKSMGETFQLSHYKISGETFSDLSLVAHLDHFQKSKKERKVTIIADRGMGKSTLLLHYAYTLAKRLFNSDKSCRIPILINLSGQMPSIEQGYVGIIERFIYENNLECSSATIEFLMKQGKLIFLFDALDEMYQADNPQIQMAHLNELAYFFHPSNKVILAGEKASSPQIEESSQITQRIFGREIYLESWTEDQVKNSLQKYSGNSLESSKLGEYIQTNRSLQKLLAKPFFCHLVCDIMEKLIPQKQEHFIEYDLLKTYTHIWIEIINPSSDSFMNKKEKRAKFLEKMALHIFLAHKQSIQTSELISLYKENFSLRGLSEENLSQNIKTCLQTCPFLFSPREGIFQFSHKIFLEFFVASHILKIATREEGNIPQKYHERLWGTSICFLISDKIKLENEKMLYGQIFYRLTGINLGNNLEKMFSQFLSWNGKKNLTLDFSAARLNGLQILLLLGCPYHWIERYLFSEPMSKLFGTSEDRGFSPRCLKKLHLRGANLRKADLSGIDLRQVDLQGAHLQGSNLKGANLQLSNLQETNLQGCQLEGANLQGACLYKSYLQKVNLSNSNLVQADLREAHLEGANLWESNMQGCNLQKAHLSEATLSQANLQGADLQQSNLQQTKLLKTYLVRANLSEANLEKADLSNANLEEANAEKAHFRESNLYKANLQETNLHEADLQGANLQEANLQYANLQEAKLPESNLQYTNFQYANLEEANLQGCNLQGANLQYANLYEAKMARAKITQTELDNSSLEDKQKAKVILVKKGFLGREKTV